MKTPRLIEILISVKYFRRGNKLYQHYQYDNQKNLKYILDPRYLIKQLFNAKIVEHSLTRDLECEYIEKREETGEVILTYETTKTTTPDPFYFKVVDFIPPHPGCEFCQFKKIESNNLICVFQNNKILKKEIIVCRLFRQKRIFRK
jgi:hypothetical protein